MALKGFYGTRTRAASMSPQILTTNQENINRNQNDNSRTRSAKRRVDYEDDNPSPLKRFRPVLKEAQIVLTRIKVNRSSPVKLKDFLSCDDENITNVPKDPEIYSSPVKMKALSFYGKGKVNYLSPLDRKNLDIKNKWTPFRNDYNSKNNIPVKPKSTPKGKSVTKILSSQEKKKDEKRPLQEIDPLLVTSPSRNKTKLETRVYSPSRKNQKFFKSRRSNTPQTTKPAALFHKKGLKLSYKPTGIRKKEHTFEKQTFKFIVPNKSKKHNRSISSPLLSPNSASPARNTRSSPLKKMTPTRVRNVIHSTKNPNSPDLFAPSDWDFGDENENEQQVNELNSDASSIVSHTSSMSVNYSEDSRTIDDSSSLGSSDNTNLQASLSPELSVSTRSDSNTFEDSDTEIKEKEIDTPKLYSIFTSKRNWSSTETSASPFDKHRKIHASQGNRSGSKLRSLVDKDGKEQMTLDFGQTLKGAVQCSYCGMTYNHGQPSDETLHRKFHDRIFGVLKFQGWKKETVLQEFPDGSRIIVVMPDEKQPMKKVMAIKKIVDEDLGFVVDSSSIRSNAKVFLFISEDKEIVGFCVAETISSAYQALRSDKLGEQSEDSNAKPWCCSTKPVKARCGINRVWVLRSARQKKVATKLLDCVRANFLLGFPLKKMDVAFTDPTPDGRAFATKYIGTESFLVYKR